MLLIDNKKVTDPQSLIDLCPFGAIERSDEGLVINAGCKMCRLCLKNDPNGAVYEQEEPQEKPRLDPVDWQGICVFAEQVEGVLHPVSFELLGKARELAAVTGHPVWALLIGDQTADGANTLLTYGAEQVFTYEDATFRNFNIELYTTLFADFVKKYQPSTLLVGATTIGRQLAPRLAARLRTGLTADCTILGMEENTDLIQIRPAFGGNIMAEISTPNHRPQMATVRYKIMSALEPTEPTGTVIPLTCGDHLATGIETLQITAKPPETYIEQAEVLVAVGRGFTRREELSMAQALADALGGQLACTRPLVENGWVEAKRQIGLSGRTVRPRLIITLGISGTVQFTAGMSDSDCIVAVNSDPDAPIFKVAHYGLVGDMHEIVPAFLAARGEGAR